MNDRNRADDVEIAWRSLTAAMLDTSAVHSVEALRNGNAIRLPANPGVYAFWWIGERDRLLEANRHIVLKGPGGRDFDVYYHDWWPGDAPYPCLYVGKSTNLKARFRQHLLPGTAERAHLTLDGNLKAQPRTTSCQLRFGIEHIFPKEQKPLKLISKDVGFSWCDEFLDNAVAERFFAEDRLVGHLRPWFNIDSER